MIKDVLFAKQPIFDAENSLFGLEILYRNNQDNHAVINDGKLATTELLVNYCSGLLDGATGSYVKVFVNLNRDLILSDWFFPLPPGRIVIDITGDVIVDVDFLVRISELKTRGYSFALENYQFDSQFDDLLALVDYIKMDISTFHPDEIGDKYRLLKHEKLAGFRNPPVILATKVETEEIHEICTDVGFSLFQGYFLARPTMVYGKKIVPSSQNALRLLTALQKEDVTIEEVSDLVSQDVQQSFLILKIVNSPICNFPRKIESIKEGITYIGLKQVKQWAMVLAITGSSKVPKELFRMLLERAKTCELYALNLSLPNIDRYFTTGLFSGLDLVLQADKHWLLDQVSLSKEVVSAILNYEGCIGNLLQNVIDLEEGRLEKLESISGESNQLLIDANLQAMKWTSELIPVMNSVNNQS